MARYVIIFLALIALLIALMVSLMPKQQRADLTFVNRGSISTLDPAAMSWMQDIRMALTIWEGLYTYDPVTTEPIPGAASGVDISADKRTYTFHIRPDARWSNGDSLTADDFVYAWRRALEPGTTADYGFFFDLIDGVKEYVSWRLEAAERLGGIGDVAKREAALNAHLADADVRFNETVGISALDEKTLRVRLARPVAYFLDLCAFSIFLPVHRESVDPFKIVGETGLIYYDEQWVKPGHTQWNGPFVLEDWAFKRHLRLRKNPYYWDQDNVRLDSIEAVEVEDPNTAWLLYSGGRVDWLSSIDTVYTPKLIAQSNSPVAGAVNHKGAKRNDIHSFPAFGTYFYNFNCTDKLPDGSSNPFQDVRVRQAFTMAVNKQELVDEVVRRSNPTATTFIPPRTIAKYPDVSGLPYDVERAQSLMAAAGFPDGKGFPEVVVLFNTGFQHGEIAQAIIGMWSATLGIKGRVHGKEVKTFREDKKNVNYVICRASWYGDYSDPTTFLEMFQTGNGNNDSGYSDETFDQMLLDAEKLDDPQARLEMLAEAERYLVNDGLPLLPLYHYVNVFAFDPDRVKNLYLTPRMMTMMKYIEVTP